MRVYFILFAILLCPTISFSETLEETCGWAEPRDIESSGHFPFDGNTVNFGSYFISGSGDYCYCVRNHHRFSSAFVHWADDETEIFGDSDVAGSRGRRLTSCLPMGEPQPTRAFQFEFGPSRNRDNKKTVETVVEIASTDGEARVVEVQFLPRNLNLQDALEDPTLLLGFASDFPEQDRALIVVRGFKSTWLPGGEDIETFLGGELTEDAPLLRVTFSAGTEMGLTDGELTMRDFIEVQVDPESLDDGVDVDGLIGSLQVLGEGVGAYTFQGSDDFALGGRAVGEASLVELNSPLSLDRSVIQLTYNEAPISRLFAPTLSSSQ